MSTRRSALPIDHAKVAKLCITPFGLPVVPEVYMMVASSLPARTGSPCSGAVVCTICAHCGWLVIGASGVAMQGRPSGMPGAMASQPSSLPMNSSFASLCSRIWRMVPAASVG